MRSRLLTVLVTVALSIAGLVVSTGPAAADPARCNGWAVPADLYAYAGFSFRTGGTPLYRAPYND